jgi:hypothetical protein
MSKSVEYIALTDQMRNLKIHWFGSHKHKNKHLSVTKITKQSPQYFCTFSIMQNQLRRPRSVWQWRLYYKVLGMEEIGRRSHWTTWAGNRGGCFLHKLEAWFSRLGWRRRVVACCTNLAGPPPASQPPRSHSRSRRRNNLAGQLLLLLLTQTYNNTATDDITK